VKKHENFTMPYSILSPVVKGLLIANGVIFFLGISFANQLISLFALWPIEPSSLFMMRSMSSHFQPLQLITYAFLHGNVMHLLLNMYALWLFGSRLEKTWGSKAFSIYYFICVFGAGLVQLLVSTLSVQHGGGYYPTLGASGGVFGLLLAFGMTFPNEILILVFPPIAIKAKWFVTIFGGFELWAGVTGTTAGVAHFAHLGGMLFGYLLLLYWRKHQRY
jgi:rhomboid family protein